MALTPRQQLTLQHLKEAGITEPMEIIKWCVNALSKPGNHGHRPRTGTRKHSKTHYQAIISYLAQQTNNHG